MPAHRITWFSPERPVENGTVFVRPEDAPINRPSGVSQTMLTALRRAVEMEQHGPQGEPWITSRDRRTREALARRGLAEEYRVTPHGQDVYYRITDAGRVLVAQLDQRGATKLAKRGTSNRNARGSVYDRAARRKFLLTKFGDGETCPCYRCAVALDASTITVDRIVPGALGGRYTRDNIRPACSPCNSETGGQLTRRAS